MPSDTLTPAVLDALAEAYQRGVRAERARIVGLIRDEAEVMAACSKQWDTCDHERQVLDLADRIDADALDAEPAGGKGE